MSKVIKKLFVLALFLSGGLLQAMESNNESTDSPSSLECECEDCIFENWPPRKRNEPSPSSRILEKLKEKFNGNQSTQQEIIDKLKFVESPRSNSDAEQQALLVLKCLKKKEK